MVVAGGGVACPTWCAKKSAALLVVVMHHLHVQYMHVGTVIPLQYLKPLFYSCVFQGPVQPSGFIWLERVHIIEHCDNNHSIPLHVTACMCCSEGEAYTATSMSGMRSQQRSGRYRPRGGAGIRGRYISATAPPIHSAVAWETHAGIHMARAGRKRILVQVARPCHYESRCLYV